MNILEIIRSVIEIVSSQTLIQVRHRKMYDENDSLPCSFLTRHGLLCFFCRIVHHPSLNRISRIPLIGYLSEDRTVDCPLVDLIEYQNTHSCRLVSNIVVHLEVNCLVGRAVPLFSFS
jgi:hypothetical protein